MKKMVFIDTHTHLNDEIYGRQPDGTFDAAGCDEMVRRAVEAGVEMMILPGTSLGELEGMKALAARHPDRLRMFAGLHPTELTDNPDEALRIVERELDTPGLPYVGVGEIGIDLHEDPGHRERQMAAFDAQCRMALRRGLPINIHCRDGLDETLEVLSGLPAVPRGAFHCFGGSAADVERIRRVGDFYFGINGIVTFKKSTIPALLPAIPRDRLLLETDSPYLAPVPCRGRRNESAYLRHTAVFVASALDIPVEQLAETTTANALRLFPAIATAK